MSTHGIGVPEGITPEEFSQLEPVIRAHHTFAPGRNTCTSLLAQRIQAPPGAVWRFVRDFGNPGTYKHFIKSCRLRGEGGGGGGRKGGGDGAPPSVGSVRDLMVISGLPASTSVERLELFDDARRILSFRVIGGEHRLRNYRSVTSVNELPSRHGGGIYTVVLESYIVDVPEGNTGEDTKLFADTVVKLNLQNLEAVSVESCNRH